MADVEHPAERPPSRRRQTIPPAQSVSSFHSTRRLRVTRTIPTDSSTKGVDQWFSCYEGLTWEKLKGYLEEKWPSWRGKFHEQKVKDRWVFKAPEKLTEKDKACIAALRDNNQIQLKDSESDSE